jgi:hypothetical protein
MLLTGYLIKLRHDKAGRRGRHRDSERPAAVPPHGPDPR